jgi:hypothetical protein
MEEFDATAEEELRKMIREKLKQHFSAKKPESSNEGNYSDIELLVIIIIITILLHSSRSDGRKKEYYYRKAVHKKHRKDCN